MPILRAPVTTSKVNWTLSFIQSGSRPGKEPVKETQVTCRANQDCSHFGRPTKIRLLVRHTIFIMLSRAGYATQSEEEVRTGPISILEESENSYHRLGE